MIAQIDTYNFDWVEPQNINAPLIAYFETLHPNSVEEVKKEIGYEIKYHQLAYEKETDPKRKEESSKLVAITQKTLDFVESHGEDAIKMAHDIAEDQLYSWATDNE